MRNANLLISEIISYLVPSFSGKGTNHNSTFRRTIKDYRSGNYTSLEIASFKSIENLRKELLLSPEVIKKVEYGAGSRVIGSERDSKELVKDIARSASKNRKACLLLYHLMRTIKPHNAIELGTCLGISTAYQSLALKENGVGKLMTIEGSPYRAKIANKNLSELPFCDNVEVKTGRFDQVLAEVLPTMDCIDYAFIDGHHEEEATINYFKQLIPYFKKGGIMVFDDIFWSNGMNKAWKTIKASEKVEMTLEYKGMGVVYLAETV